MKIRKTLNKALLRRIATKLRRLRHEAHYNQAKYAVKNACGTACCIAGHIAVESGWKPDFKERNEWGPVEWIKGDEREDIIELASALIGRTGDIVVDEKKVSIWDGPSLFTANPRTSWPEPFAKRWRNAKRSGERRSRIAADLLDAIADGKYKLYSL